MRIESLNNTMATALAQGPSAAMRGERFARMLSEASTGAPAQSADEARQAAEQLVATALVVPLLAELREQPLDAKLFHGGPAEDAFRGQLDTLLADKIVRSGRFPIVDRIHEDITRQRAMKAGQPQGVDILG